MGEDRGYFCLSRHWFSVYGMPGLRAPVCQRHGCSAPNPTITEEERANYESFMKNLNRTQGEGR
jgi:hypothetical protein